LLPSVPKPIALTSPQDYATFLTRQAGTVVRLGDDFCAPADRDYRGSNLGYGFYSGDEGFLVWPAFDGKVVAVRDDEYGCGRAVYVDSGDFVTVYSGITSIVENGDVVGPWTEAPIGRVFKSDYCPNAHLTVVFAEPSFELYEGTDRCGKPIDCERGFEPPPGSGPLRCAVGQPCEPIAGVPLGVREEYCVALEWPVRRSATGLLWGRTAEGFERAPVEFGFRMTDSFDIVNCSEHDKERLTWLNPKDLLCYNGTLWSCGSHIAIPGASTASADECIGDGPNCENGYKCAEYEITSVPILQAEWLLTDRTISKFCDSGDMARDWVCCAGTGGILQCGAGRWRFENGEMVCADSVACIAT
jgi:hypothetical protein